MSDPRPVALPRVLFIEDDDLVRRCVGRALRKSAEVIAVGGAEEARGLLRERPFDLVVSDLTLFDGDGLALLGEAARFLPSAALVLYSGHEPPPAARRALDEGLIAAFLRKPEGLAQLTALVGGWAPAGG